jgi:hypothetical protein
MVSSKSHGRMLACLSSAPRSISRPALFVGGWWEVTGKNWEAYSLAVSLGCAFWVTKCNICLIGRIFCNYRIMDCRIQIRMQQFEDMDEHLVAGMLADVAPTFVSIIEVADHSLTFWC